jgi:uncharacterized protein (TIGR00730 family)
VTPQDRLATVFGSSLPKPGQPDYDQALALGAGLAKLGWGVITGGYAGTMEAVSRGAAEAGGHTVGVTCAQIESWRGARRNAWVQKEVRCQTLRERLYELIRRGNVLMALPGGIGTLSEVTLSWSLVQTQEVGPRPLILIGAGWQHTFETFLSQAGEYVPSEDAAALAFAAGVSQALDRLSGAGSAV